MLRITHQKLKFYPNHDIARFNAIDANGDMKIDFAEALAVLGDRELEDLPRKFTEMDEDGDGLISPTEFDQDMSEEDIMRAEQDADSLGNKLPYTLVIQLAVFILIKKVFTNYFPYQDTIRYPKVTFASLITYAALLITTTTNYNNLFLQLDIRGFGHFYTE